MLDPMKVRQQIEKVRSAVEQRGLTLDWDQWSRTDRERIALAGEVDRDTARAGAAGIEDSGQWIVTRAK